MIDPMKYKRLANATAFKWSQRNIVRQRNLGSSMDVYQEAMVGLLKAVDKYDQNRGSFTTFVSRCIWNHLHTATNLKRHAEIRGFDLTHSKTLVEERDRTDVISAMLRLKSRDQAILVRLFWDDWTLQEIANSYGVSKQYIQKLASEALAKIKESIE